jgi:exodeoxyribonuclease V gamma subunit
MTIALGSTLYLGTDPESLAGQLASQVAETVCGGDGFVPVPVIVPNRYLGKWLRLDLARRLGVAVNLQFRYLEEVAWDLLRQLDPQPGPVERLDDDALRFMILSLLLEETDDAALAPLRGYLQRATGAPPRDYYRRAWQLADRLAGLVRDYEYHRADELVRRWLDEGADGAGVDPLDLDRGQRELYRQVLGLRDQLGQHQGKTLRTLPQYAGEVMRLRRLQPRPAEASAQVHVFGVTQISTLHVRILRWLGQRYDLRIYHLNPLCGRLGTLPSVGRVRPVLRKLAEGYRAPDVGSHGRTAGDGLLALWGQAGAESLWVMADLLDGPRAFRAEVVQPTSRRRAGVLGRLQEHLLGREPEPGACRLPPDATLQIVACPGIYREVETVYHSILDNLHRDQALKQTDVAVLVTDMPRYRPVLQAVFDRRPRRLSYNLADFSAAELSSFGHGVLGLLDLALEAFTRSRVFATLLNPCFLARLGVDREQALVWLEWAEALGIYHGWDRKDRQERGYADTPLYSWRLGLQRLRLGRLMDVPDENADAPPVHYQNVVPFADLESGDREQLDAFCRAVEGLLPVLVHLRDRQTTGEQWAEQIRRLVKSFLAVPADRPEEEEVRGKVLEEVDQLRSLDALCRLQGREARLPLALVREFMQGRLEGRFGTKGEYLTGGVTLSALQPLRPVPFEIIYVLGLGEGLFPGTSVLPALDLRSRRRCAGDIRLPESNRFLLVEALQAARRKVYLLYNSRDLQKDRDLYPSSPLNQLRRHLEQHVVDGEFEPIKAPLCGNDPDYVSTQKDQAKGDALANYSDFERLLAVEDIRRDAPERLDQRQTHEAEARLKKARPDFTPPTAEPSAAPATVTVPLSELRRFLRCPAEAALRRHLDLNDEEETEAQDDEPFYTAGLAGSRLTQRFLQRFVRGSIEHGADAALRVWRDWFSQLYEDGRLRGRAPDGAFAQVDRARIEESLRDRIEGPRGLAPFLQERAGLSACGPVLLGESSLPIGARSTFPALALAPAQGASVSLPASVRLVGSQAFVWRTPEALELLVPTPSKKKITAGTLSSAVLEPLLFYLALKAGTEPGLEGESSADWLGQREFHLHMAREGDIVRFCYRPDDISSERAREYLAELVRDLLDPTCFDLLPFDLVPGNKGLQVPFTRTDENILAACRALRIADRDEAQQLRKELGLDEDDVFDVGLSDGEILTWFAGRYPGKYQEAVEENEEQMHPDYWPMGLMKIIETRVPDDAWARMRRRFQLLDSGPARDRQTSSSGSGRGGRRARK